MFVLSPSDDVKFVVQPKSRPMISLSRFGFFKSSLLKYVVTYKKYPFGFFTKFAFAISALFQNCLVPFIWIFPVIPDILTLFCDLKTYEFLYYLSGMQVSSDLNFSKPCFCKPFLTRLLIVFSFEIILATIACFC